MSYTITVELFTEFDAAHKVGGFEPITIGQRRVWPDGAFALASDCNQRWAPSADRRECLTLRAEYHKAWLNRIAEDFQRTQQNYLNRIDFVSFYGEESAPSPIGSEAIFDQMEALAGKHRSALYAIDAELATLRDQEPTKDQAYIDFMRQQRTADRESLEALRQRIASKRIQP